MDVSAFLELQEILYRRIYSPESYIKRQPDELLTNWQSRALLTPFTRVEYRNSPEGKVIVAVIKLDESK